MKENNPALFLHVLPSRNTVHYMYPYSFYLFFK